MISSPTLKKKLSSAKKDDREALVPSFLLVLRKNVPPFSVTKEKAGRAMTDLYSSLR